MGRDTLAFVGALTLGLIAVFVAFGLGISIATGAWAEDRFVAPNGHHAVVVRLDDYAKPLWICADGKPERPLNCLSRAELVEAARARWRRR